MSLEFATAKHLYRLWTLFKKLLSLSDAKITALERVIQYEDIGDDLFTVIDAASNILFALDKHGRARFPVGILSRGADIDGDHMVKGTLNITDCRIMEGDESGLFYLLDSNDRILLGIDANGNTDFKGIPSDIKAKFEGLETRIAALEGNS